MAEQIMTSKGLLEPVLESGLEDVHFFNGRLLTALDLQKMQEANRLQHHQLGQAIGAGVVHGLEVSLVDDGSGGGSPVVSVTAGLAVNRLGHALTLPAKTNVMLTDTGETATQDAGLFQVCTPPKGGTVPTGEGVYVLTIRLASGFREWVPKRGFAKDGKVDGCGRRYTVEGVQFRLEELSLDSITGLDQDTRDDLADLMEEIDELRFKPDAASRSQRRAKLSKLRNWLAHVCLGTEEVAGFCKDPFARTGGQSPYLTYGAVDALLAEGQLTDCDVPLALLYWTTSRVHFVDMWSVRRRPARPIRSASWPLVFSDRRQAEGEASLLQFQEQVEALSLSSVSDSTLGTIQARQCFRYLPAAGLLPVAGSGGAGAIDYDTFFAEMTIRDPIFIEGAQLRPLLQEAVSYPPIDTATDVVVWLYTVRENAQALLSAAGLTQGYLVFASGHMPYRGEARYDVHHWDFGNYS